MKGSEISSFPIERGSDGVRLPPPGEGGTPLLLRALTADEAQGLAATFARIEPWSRYPFGVEALAAYLSAHEAGAPRYAILEGDSICGALGLRLNWLRGPYIQFLGLVPQWQGRRCGQAVLSWIVEAARADGARNVWVAASAFNVSALRFYERHGFARAGVLDGLVTDGIDEVLLRKRLV